MMTVVKIEHLLKVKNLIVLIIFTYIGILTFFTEKSPKRTATKLVIPIINPILNLLRASLIDGILIPIFSKNLKEFGLNSL